MTGPGRGRRHPRGKGGQRPLRRPDRKRRDPFRPPDAPGRGAQEQRHRTDAASGTGDLSYAFKIAAVRDLARECGFELAGVAPAAPVPERAWYREWAAAGYAGEMGYLTDRRAGLRESPQSLLPAARSVICVGKLYNTPWPYSTKFAGPGRAWISRYAWGGDYHDVVRRGLERLRDLLRERAGTDFESKICVDTAPLLERSYARMAGLGWIGKNTCLINQQSGSWFFWANYWCRWKSRRLRRRGKARRRTGAEPVRDVSRPVPRRRLCLHRPASEATLASPWIHGCAFPTSPSSCAAIFPKIGAAQPAVTSSAATSARTSVPGTGRPRYRAKPRSRPEIGRASCRE